MIDVLHVDDDSEFLDLTAEFLERLDDQFEVISETGAVEGFERLTHTEFDCIVSDYKMPEKDGLAFLRTVREEYPDLPFILFTSQGSEEVASEAISAGATEYLQKQGGIGQYEVLANRIRNSVERYRASRQIALRHRVLDTAREGLSIVAADGTFTYVNKRFAELFEYERNELIGTHWKILYHEEEAKRLEHDILPAVRETGRWAGETVRLTKYGDRKVTDHRLTDTNEDVLVCTAQDITDQRIDASESGDEFELLVQAVTEYVFYMLDHEGYITRWNSDAEQLEGYGTKEVLGEHIDIFFTREDRSDGVPEQLLETAKSEGSVTDEGWRVRKDGSRFWAEATISANYDDAGTLQGFGKIIKEATEPPTP